MEPESKPLVQEREWTDDFGDHYEARAIGRDGLLYIQTVTKYPDGWHGMRGEAYNNVLRKAL
jgi:hypothetical protein